MYNKKLIGFFLIALILAVCIGTASASENATLTSTNEEKTFTDIQTEIDNACENDTIELEGTYKSQGKLIEVNKDLTFKGRNDATLDGNMSSRIINSNRNLVFENLKFQHAYSYGDGGAIKSSGNLTFFNCTFICNEQKKINPIFYRGTAIEGTILTVDNCTFMQNSGRTTVSASTMDIRNSKFIDNPTEYGIQAHTLTVDNCDFKNNKIVIGDWGDYDIKNSRFDNNKYGIKIYADSTLKIDNCNFTNNKISAVHTASETTFSNSRFTKNKIAIYAFTTPTEGWDIPIPIRINVTNCTFKSNTDTAISTSSNAVIKNSTFEANNGKMAGAIHSCNSYGDNKIKISDSTFTNNTAEYAGAIYAKGADVTITNSTLKNNTHASIILTNCMWSREGDTYRSTGELNIDSKTFTKNVNLNDNLKEMEIAKLTVNKVKTSYYSGATLNIKIVNKFTKKPWKESRLILKVFTGKKYKKYAIYTNNKGIAKFKASTLNKGSHKIEITTDIVECKIKKTTTVATITKAKTIIKAPKVTAKYKKSKYFKISIKNKATKKPVKGTYIKVKIDKKTHKIKTNSKGIAKINTKKLKIGKHKVTITSANANYQMSAKSTITIK